MTMGKNTNTKTQRYNDQAQVAPHLMASDHR